MKFLIRRCSPVSRHFLSGTNILSTLFSDTIYTATSVCNTQYCVLYEDKTDVGSKYRGQHER